MRKPGLALLLIGILIFGAGLTFDTHEKTTVEVSDQNPDTTIPYEELSSEEQELVDGATSDGLLQDGEASTRGVHFTGTTGVTVDGESYLLLVSHETVPHIATMIGMVIGALFCIGGMAKITEHKPSHGPSTSETIEIETEELSGWGDEE